MKKNGFTLVELLAAIVLLGMLSLIIIPSVIQTVDKFKNKAYDDMVNNIESTAKLYISNNRSSIPNINIVDSTVELQLRDLVLGGMIKAPVIDPLNNEEVSLDTKIVVKVLAKNRYEITLNYNIPDTESPVIALLGESAIDVPVGTPYTDEGATAIDNVEGDITSRLVMTSNVNPNVIGLYTVTYDVTDKAGNAATTVTRYVNVIDLSSPIITILGDNPASIELGSTYTDAGATATDNIDGDITANITVTGSVNPNIIGSYSITYSVSDAAGNTVVAIRTVKVVDTTAPAIVINPNGNSTYAKSRTAVATVTDAGGIGNTKYQWTTSASTPSEASFTATFASGSNLSTPTDVTGNYYLWIYAIDISGNKIIQGSNPFALDNTDPTVAFGTNGNSSYAKTRSTTATVSDSLVAVDSNSLKYLWNTSTTAPSEASFSVAFTNGATITSPAGVTGSYYLWILAKDALGNTTITRTNAFNLDNTSPACAAAGGSSSWFNVNRTITISCSDGNSGVSTCNGVAGTSSSATYSANTNTTYSYTVVDNVGNSGTCSALVKIDKTPPSAPSIARSPGAWTEGNVTLTPSCSDTGGSNIASCTPTIVSRTPGTYTFTATDGAGNSATSTAAISNTTEYQYTDRYVDFNGSSSYLKSNTAGIYGLLVDGGASPFVFEAGITIDSTANNFYIFDTGESDGDPRFALWYRASSGKIALYAKNSGTVYIDYEYNFTPSTGTYYVVRLQGGTDSSRGYTLYINNASKGTSDSCYRFADANQYTHIGRRYTAADYLNGRIYFFRFKGRKADTADVDYHYYGMDASTYWYPRENGSTSYRFNFSGTAPGSYTSGWTSSPAGSVLGEEYFRTRASRVLAY